MSYQEPDDEDEYLDDDAADDETDNVLEPWQAQYSWRIITCECQVPDAVHAAAVAWWVEQLRPSE